MKQLNKAEFVNRLRQEAEKAAGEYHQLVHELHRLEMEQARAKDYLDKLNLFLKEHGEEEVNIKEE